MGVDVEGRHVRTWMEPLSSLREQKTSLPNARRAMMRPRTASMASPCSSTSSPGSRCAYLSCSSAADAVASYLRVGDA